MVIIMVSFRKFRNKLRKLRNKLRKRNDFICINQLSNSYQYLYVNIRLKWEDNSFKEEILQ